MTFWGIAYDVPTAPACALSIVTSAHSITSAQYAAHLAHALTWGFWDGKHVSSRNFQLGHSVSLPEKRFGLPSLRVSTKLPAASRVCICMRQRRDSFACGSLSAAAAAAAAGPTFVVGFGTHSLVFAHGAINTHNTKRP
eukprot:6455107-Amphidinium_carterae.4